MSRLEIQAILMIIDLISLNIINGCECCCTSCRKRKATSRYIYIGGNSTTDDEKSKNSTNNDYSTQNSQSSKPEKEETDKSSDKITNNTEGKEKLMSYIREKENSRTQNNITKEKIDRIENTNTNTNNTYKKRDKDNLENNVDENNLQDNYEKNNESLNNSNVDLNTKNDNNSKISMININKGNEEVNKLEENENEHNSYDFDEFVNICVIGPEEKEEQKQKEKEEKEKERQKQLERERKEREENEKIEKEEKEKEKEEKEKERQKQLEREKREKEDREFLERITKEREEYENKRKEEEAQKEKEMEETIKKYKEECRNTQKTHIRSLSRRLSKSGLSLSMQEEILLENINTENYKYLTSVDAEEELDFLNISAIKPDDNNNTSTIISQKELKRMNDMFNRNREEAEERKAKLKEKEDIRIQEEIFNKFCERRNQLEEEYKEKPAKELSPKFTQKDNDKEPIIIFENAIKKKAKDEFEGIDIQLYDNYVTRHCLEISSSDKEYNKIFNSKKYKREAETQIFRLSDSFYNEIIDYKGIEIIQLESTIGKTIKEKNDTLNASMFLIGNRKDDRAVIGLYYPNITSLIALIELETGRNGNKYNEEKGRQEEYDKYLLFFHGCKDCSEYFRDSKIKNIKIIHRTFTNADEMFYGCKDLKNITFEEYNINKQVKELNYKQAYPTFVTARNMFKNCTNLEKVSIKFNEVLIGENTTDVTEMFSGCTNLKEIDKFISDNLNPEINMKTLFNDCTSLKNIVEFKIPNGIATKENIDQMFYRCKNLSEDFINNIPDNIKEITGLTKNTKEN